jgi:hypothetical protein
MGVMRMIEGRKGTAQTTPAKPGMLLTIAVCLVLQGVLIETVSATGTGCYARSEYVFPPQIEKEGVSFAGTTIPLHRKDVRQRVQEQMSFLLMDRRARLLTWFDRLVEYGPTMGKVLAEENVPADLIYLAVLLSDLQPLSKHRSGGVGWWALAAPKSKKSQPPPWISTDDWDDRRDPVLSTKIACAILKGIHPRKDNGDWLMAIAAFADGSDAVDEVVGKAPGFSYWDLVMPHYSEVLIPRLVALKLIDTHRAFYQLDATPDPPGAYDFLGRLKLIKDLPLHVVATWCRVTPRAMWEINPGVSPANGILPKADSRFPAGFPLRVPAGTERTVRELLVKEGYLAS